MTNGDTAAAVREATRWAVCRSVQEAVGRNLYLHMDQSEDLYDTTRNAVCATSYWAVGLASSKEPNHPALEDFLVGVEAR